MEVKDRKINKSTKVLYGVGAFGYGSVGQTVNSFLVFFGTGVLGIPGTLMGLAVAIGTIWDATTDPFVGHWSDKTKGRLGRRHGWIIFSCIAVAISNVILWSINPEWSVWNKFIVLTILLLIMETFNTCYSTPYSALGIDLSQNYDDRTAMQNYKTAFSFLSLLVPSLLMTVYLSPTRYNSMAQSTQGYIDIAIITSILCVICGIICFAGTWKYRHGNVSAEDNSEKPRTKIAEIFSDFFSIIKQKNVGRLIVGYAISLTAGAFLTTLGLHVFTYTFGFSTLQIPIIMTCLIGGIIVGQPIWYFISRRTDKITALILSLATLLTCMAVFAVVLIFRSTVPHNVTLLFVSIAIFASGVGTGCLYSLPISMFADCIALQTQETGVDKTGKSAGFLTFCTKISNAFIMFVIGLGLDIIGFRGGAIQQSMFTQNWLGWLLIAGVSIASVFAMIVYSKYSYTKKDFN